MSDGPVVGRMPKGSTSPHPAAQPDEAGRPSRAPESRPAPRGEQHQKDAHKSVGANSRKPR